MIRIMSITPELEYMATKEARKDVDKNSSKDVANSDELDLDLLAKETWSRFSNEESTMQLFPEVGSLLS